MLTPVGTGSLLDADPELGSALEPAEFEVARQRVRVALMRVDKDTARGKWGDGSPQVGGLLVTEGAVLREVSTARRVTAELIGPGDMIRPFGEDGAEDLPLRAEIVWRVIQPPTLAVIDARVLQTAAQWPPIVAALVARSVRRTQRLAVNFSLSHMVRIADRLLLLFWHLATHRGRVTPDGVVIELPLSHSQLALMVGSERPSVTTALGQLAREGLVTRLDNRAWMLRGPIPEDVAELLNRTTALARAATTE